MPTYKNKPSISFSILITYHCFSHHFSSCRPSLFLFFSCLLPFWQWLVLRASAMMLIRRVSADVVSGKGNKTWHSRLD